MNEPGKLKIWGFWNILGEERYGAGKERIRPWYYAMSLLCRYFPQGAQILASGVSGVGGVRSMFGRTEKGVTLAVVNTDSERTVELTLENPQPGLSDLALYVYAPGRLRLGGERLLPVERGGGACARKPDQPGPRDDARLHLDGMTGYFPRTGKTNPASPKEAGFCLSGRGITLPVFGRCRRRNRSTLCIFRNGRSRFSAFRPAGVLFHWCPYCLRNPGMRALAWAK